MKEKAIFRDIIYDDLEDLMMDGWLVLKEFELKTPHMS